MSVGGKYILTHSSGESPYIIEGYTLTRVNGLACYLLCYYLAVDDLSNVNVTGKNDLSVRARAVRASRLTVASDSYNRTKETEKEGKGEVAFHYIPTPLDSQLYLLTYYLITNLIQPTETQIKYRLDGLSNNITNIQHMT